MFYHHPNAMVFSFVNWIIPVREWWVSWQLSVQFMWPIGIDFGLIIALLSRLYIPAQRASKLSLNPSWPPPVPVPDGCLLGNRKPRRVLLLVNWIRGLLPIGPWCPTMCGVWYGDWPQRYRAAIFAFRLDTNCGLGSRADSSMLMNSQGITTITKQPSIAIWFGHIENNCVSIQIQIYFHALHWTVESQKHLN